MSKWFKNILALVVMGFLIGYLYRHWDELGVMLELRWQQIVLMYLLWFALTVSCARAEQGLIKALDKKTSYLDLLRLYNAAVLLNYAPMKFGTVFRANYIKRHYGLPYAHFATMFLYVVFLLTSTASFVGLIMLVCFFGLEAYESKILAGVFILTILGSLGFLFFPIPIPKGQGKLSSILRNFLLGRKQVGKKHKAIFLSLLMFLLAFIFTALRLWIVYQSIGTKINPAGYLILGALSFVVLFIGLTPGGLGIREAVLGFGAVVLGVPLKVGLLAAMIDRAVTISYAFIVGGSCCLYLWRKSPADFKEDSQDNKSVYP